MASAKVADANAEGDPGFKEPHGTRWTFHDPALLWLFPGTLVLHLIEEWASVAPLLLWGVRRDAPRAMLSFAVPTLTGLTLMIVGVRLAIRDRRFHWIVPALATAILLNTAGHLVGSGVDGQYSAGLITAAIFWIPLGLLTLVRVATQSTPRTLWGGMAVGSAIEIVVVGILAATA